MCFKRNADLMFSTLRVKISTSTQFSLTKINLSEVLIVVRHNTLLITLTKFRDKSFVYFLHKRFSSLVLVPLRSENSDSSPKHGHMQIHTSRYSVLQENNVEYHSP